MYVPDPFDGATDTRSISFRNNNPLNLRPGGGAWQGMRGTMTHPRAGAFVVFDSAEMGFRAAAITLINYGRLFGRDTLAKIVRAWAPPSENDTGAYVAAVEDATGIGRDVTLDLLNDPGALARLMDAMTRVESGGHQPYRIETIRHAIGLAYKRFGKIVGDWPNSGKEIQPWRAEGSGSRRARTAAGSEKAGEVAAEESGVGARCWAACFATSA